MRGYCQKRNERLAAPSALLPSSAFSNSAFEAFIPSSGRMIPPAASGREHSFRPSPRSRPRSIRRSYPMIRLQREEGTSALGQERPFAAAMPTQRNSTDPERGISRPHSCFLLHPQASQKRAKSISLIGMGKAVSCEQFPAYCRPVRSVGFSYREGSDRLGRDGISILKQPCSAPWCTPC